MIKETKKLTTGTSFWGTKLIAKPKQLIDLFPNSYYEENTGKDKVNFDFTLEVDGKVFTIYDWKYYRPLGLYESIVWNIGGHSFEVTQRAKEEIMKLLK